MVTIVEVSVRRVKNTQNKLQQIKLSLVDGLSAPSDYTQLSPLVIRSPYYSRMQQDPQLEDSQNILQCFRVLANPQANSLTQKQADTYLISCEQSGFSFLGSLLRIYESREEPQIRLQALICFNNVLKRNWLNKKLKNTTLPNFQKDKTSIKCQLVKYLVGNQKLFMKSLLDGVVFIAQQDFPHNFPQLNDYILQVLQGVRDIPLLTQNIKTFNAIYKNIKSRRVSIHKRYFEESSLRILEKLYPLFETLHSNIDNVDAESFSLVRAVDKMMALLLITAPHEVIDNQQMLKLVELLYQKAERLVLVLNSQQNSQFQKTLRVLVEYLGSIQFCHPFALALCFSRYVQLCLFITNSQQKYSDKTLIKYCMISLTKVMKSFVYYASDSEFQGSSYSRSKALTFLDLRNTLHRQYLEVINEKVIETLLSKLITEILSIKDSRLIDAGLSVEDEDYKIEDKDAMISRVALTLVQTIINRFPQHSLQLVNNLVQSCLSKNFEGVDRNVIINILSVVSVLPTALKTHNNSVPLADFPIQQIISYTYNSGQFPSQFALLSCKWINKFSSQEILSIVNALLSYIDLNSSNLAVLLECCLAIKTIVLTKSQQINLSSAVQKIVPVAIKLFASNDSVQVLWPMIILISKLISTVECDMRELQKALACNSLIALLQTNEELIVEALCEMFRNILCTLSRDQAYPTIYELVISFLGNQLPKSHLASFDEVLRLWYLLLREYSYVQNKNEEVKQLFNKHYNLLLRTLNQRLLFILEEYVLLNLIQPNNTVFSQVLAQFYDNGEPSTDDSLKLKIATTSVHITFITKFGIANVHNNTLLLKYLNDLINDVPSTSKLLDTFKTSITAIINRYIILFKAQFMQFIQTNNIPYSVFLNAWFNHMDSLTSRTACRLNAIALLLMAQEMEKGDLLSRFSYVMKKVIPEVVDSMSHQQSAPKVGVSPTFRLSENILSERKELIRKQGVFEEINLRELFLETMRKLVQECNLDQAAIASLMAGDTVNLELLFKLMT